MRVEVLHFRPFVKNSLQGFVTVFLPDVGIEIRGAMLHKASGKAWISLPGKSYVTEDGKQAYSYIVAFPNQKVWEGFQQAALAALDKLLRKEERQHVEQ